MQNKSLSIQLFESDELNYFSIVFRISIALILFPHCYEELLVINDLIVVYGGQRETISPFASMLHYIILISESVCTVMLCVGFTGRLSAALLGVSLSLHFIPIEDNLHGLFLFSYPVYSLLYPVLFFLTINGSGHYSIDAIISRFYKLKVD